ncbi:hypothetical protein Vi05172_g11712 [Venturia inaequalis]|nr:hypothetical protein Vi05172_g11712 [Venturia inaequalis]
MSPKKNPSGKRGSTKKEDPESAQPIAETENEPVRRLVPSSWPASAYGLPSLRYSHIVRPDESTDGLPKRSVFEPDDEPSDTIVYRPDSTEVDTKFDRDRNRFWALKAKGWPSSAESDITSPHDSIVGDKTPFTHGSDMPPAPPPDKNDTAGSDQKHPDSLSTSTPNPEDISIFSPEHPVHNQRPNRAVFPCHSNRHRNHHSIQTEEGFDPPVTEDHHDPRLSHLLSMRNAKPDGFADGIDELELIDTPTLEDKDDLELSQLSDWQELLVVTHDELECIDTGTPEEYQDLQLMIQLSNPQTTNSERLMTRNEKPGRLSYEQRKKLRTFLYVVYKLPILLLLFVAAVTDAHKPGFSESGVSSSTSSRSIIWPAYLFHPLSRKRNRDDLSLSGDDSLLSRKRNRNDLSLLQDDPSRPRRSNCDTVDGTTLPFPMCHEDDCLGLNRGKRCSETVNLSLEFLTHISHNSLTTFAKHRIASGSTVHAGCKLPTLANPVLWYRHGQIGASTHPYSSANRAAMQNSGRHSAFPIKDS